VLATVSHPGFSFGDPVALGFLVLGFALFAGIAALSHARERAFSASIIYLLIGIAAGSVVRAADVGQTLDPIAGNVTLERVTEGALVIALFATGLRFERPLALRAWQSPLRLLVVAMPLTIAAVAAWGKGAMGLGLGAAIALGAALAPTDPVLAGDLGLGPPAGEGEEERGSPEPEFALTGEAGLNDGLALPFLLLGIGLAEHGRAGGWLGEWAGANVAYGILAALPLGFVMGRLIAAAVGWAHRHDLLIDAFDRWVGVAGAFLVYGVASAVGVFGFLAVLAAGIGARRHEATHELDRDVHDGVVVLENWAELTVMLILGGMLGLHGVAVPGLSGWLLVALLILVVRPASALVSLVRAPLRVRERLWVAWFGVRGVASLNYAAVIVASGALAADAESTIVWTLVAAVAVSVVVHGITSEPVSQALLGRSRG
jgi:NhaP-type Na+/H+ or K+/H+ antiporter